ncbi:glycosyltransferase family 2 protein [Candidatus Dojkabacteria bacterium]|nr:glycosyltransferase family 2 protein [Candidatus Dojkabacteria bacterium]
MKLSIIIANYNTSKLTIDCINSVFENRPKCSFEVIVVDDASPDGSSKKLIELQNKYRQNLAGRDGKRLKVLLNLKNVGYVRSNNRGLLKSKGEYKLLLNSDTLVRQNSIDELIAFAEKTSDAGVVGSRLLNKDGSIQDSCYDFPTVWNAIGYKKFAPNGEEPTAVDIVVGASFLITPKAYKLVGRLSEKYKSYFEDFDYCRETKKKGLQVYYNPKSVITHFHGESFKQLYGKDNSWKKLIPSSIAYHGLFNHYLIFAISWIYQKINNILK